jgi:acyl-CoA synthetase (AMP-forming)/AMP-acid ligase II
VNLADVIARHARETPGAVALVENGRDIDYAAFDRAIWRASAWLREQGIAAGETVGIAMGDNALHLVIVYALARMGAVQLSLPLREPEPVRQRLARRFGVRTVIADGDAKPAWLEGGGTADASLRAPGGETGWRIVMSSGTTAEPKAVLQSHAAHCAWREIYARVVPGRPQDRYLSMVPLDFYAGVRQCMELHWAGSAVVLPGEARSPGDFLAAVERHAVNYVFLIPNQIHQLLAHLADDAPGLPGVRVLRTGAMVVSQKLSQEVHRRLTPNMVVSYGSNDVGSILAYTNREVMERHPGAVGIPSPGVRLEVVDEHGRPLPAGEPGLIRAQAPGMPAGYIDNPKATAIAFRDGWYYPGDLGMLSAGGALYFKGRADDLMNFDGIKLYPIDIEATLLEHPAVLEAAAFPLRSARHQDVPAAAVVLREPLPMRELKAWCRERLGVRAPQIIAGLDALPRNATGKVLKRELSSRVLKAARRR